MGMIGGKELQRKGRKKSRPGGTVIQDWARRPAPVLKKMGGGTK